MLMNQFKVIQVGVGGFGNVWLQALKDHPDGKIIALVDKNEEILYKQAVAYGIEKKHCYLSLSEALKKERANIIVNVTPPQTHKEVCLEGFEAGLDVITEKPLADIMKSAQKIVEIAEKKQEKIMVSQNYRFTRWAWKIKDLLTKKSLGELGYVNIIFQKGPRFAGFRAEMPYPLMIDMSIHHFDLMRNFIKSDPVEVYAKSYKPTWSWFKGDPSVNLIFTFKNGVICSYNGSWVARGFETTWNGEWRFECNNGVLFSRNDKIFIATDNESPPQEIVAETPEMEGQRYTFHDMAQAIRENRQPETNGEDNLKSLAMVFAALESAKTNKVVKL
jgi:predicted dehydrogenase